MARKIELELSDDAWESLYAQSARSGQAPAQLASSMITAALDDQRHSIFQMSTSGALVKGVFDGAISVGELLDHGDFGLGTFAGLDGELILVDGRCFRATADGVVNEVSQETRVPFAMVTRFINDAHASIDGVVDFSALKAQLDDSRSSANVFAAIRGEGSFESMTLRAACPARDGEGLLEATKHQSEFDASNTSGVLVGFWAPDYAGSVSVPGYHFHYIDADRQIGGHVLEFTGARIDLAMHTEPGIHLAMPENRRFLESDLTGDHSEELDEAETQVRGSSE